ncbi:MAG: queuine tRNA-ribosyltransferase [Parcubacteria group bacterium Gr01-1014_106]|nr:MAG: queuine tRNA-ribosyltransferase [Parcubacteria group bacterium Gr01-1014_106]
MIHFRVIKQSRRSRARLGTLETPHGAVETPALVAVATQGVIKGLLNEGLTETKTQIVIANAFHLHIKPGEHVVAAHGGLHTFARLPVPAMTDSGGWQVFSLGFGFEQGMGKFISAEHRETPRIKAGAQPQRIRITERGVFLPSPIDGRKIFLGPKESIRIQERIGADIMFAFDECTSPLATKEYVANALKRDQRWAAESLAARKGCAALFGIVHGSRFRDLRVKSARHIASLAFDGYGIGGDLGDVANEKRTMVNILRWTLPHLDSAKPRHLLGIGMLEDIPRIISEGVDLFDCTVPTRSARHGLAHTSAGKLDLKKAKFLNVRRPLDKKCGCAVCGAHTQSFLAHLVRAKEIAGITYLTHHNLYFFNSFVEEIREKIRKGLF